MTHQDRVSGVAALGFTERQANFLVHVMLHSGVCLGRQYCTFAGIARGLENDREALLGRQLIASPYRADARDDLDEARDRTLGAHIGKAREIGGIRPRGDHE